MSLVSFNILLNMERYLDKLKENSILRGDRVNLRSFDLRDAKDFYEVCSDHKVTEYLTWNPHISINETIDILKEKFINNPLFFAIELKEESKCIGCIDMRLDAENKKGSFGYMLGSKYWNIGLMTESLNMVFDLFFNKLLLNRVEATHYVGNEGSGKVMKKCGMKYEGTSPQELIIKGEFVDVVRYALLSKDYLYRR